MKANATPQIIITSFLFPGGKFSQPRLDDVLKALGGDKSKLVIDLSCRRSGDQKKWFVAMNKWQTITDMEVNQGELAICLRFVRNTHLTDSRQTRSKHWSPTALNF